jgi:predicted DNA-binding protein (UPF0251 family)
MNSESVKETSQYDKLNKELNAINTFVENFIERHRISFQEVFDLLSKLKEKEKATLVPSFILRNRKLGILESVTKYLKEEFRLGYHQIALLLKRDDRVVWATYNKAIKKKKEKFIVEEPNSWLPISIFTDKNLGPLESIAIYLKDQVNLSFGEIAKLLNRDNRTVWACYHKAKEKLDKK